MTSSIPRYAKFAKIDGRWFAVEGLVTHHARGTRDKERAAFVVGGLRINQPIPDSRFEMPPGLDDVRLLDLTAGQPQAAPVAHGSGSIEVGYRLRP